MLFNTADETYRSSAQSQQEKTNNDLIETIKTLTKTVARQTITITELQEECTKKRIEYAALKSRLQQSVLETVADERSLNGLTGATSREDTSSRTHYPLPVAVPYDSSVRALIDSINLFV